ncbi:hypothetical protein N8I77_000628 [Diaporthe amygdali]|uniref:Zn(2)-C6 fungal-type domain-containing protein n=1 Tax=Phomopsis amygdali TaxID=1214568 RepID=A0AAD9SPZ3_PHOAM|nr:hypothetical protein N8I77_000628 [Diaporthe amygdali]
MDSVAVVPEGTPADDFRPREMSPAMENNDPSPPKKANIRKRTKTGCLTCRKRRIKCDEGKPICQNCIKSKRQCEGYNTRVVFKNPMGALPGGPFGPIPHYHPDPTEALVNAQLSSTHAKASSSSQGPLPFIAPKPPSMEFGSTEHYQYLGPYPGALPRANSTTALGLGVHHPQYYMGQISPDHFFAQQSNALLDSPVQMNQPDVFDFYNLPQSPIQPLPSNSAPLAPRNASYASMERVDNSPTLPISPPFSQPSSLKLDVRDIKAEPWLLEEEEAPFVVIGEDGQSPSNSIEDPGFMIEDRSQVSLDLYGTQMRPYYGLSGDNILANYLASPMDTPLNDPQTLRIFQYFIETTAPSLSMYERNSADSSRTFSGATVPEPHRHIWTYILPSASLQHPALLQAILAIGSLQMAVLNGDVPTASWLHYGLCTRRSSKNYQSAIRRAEPATLAATLLLGFYEVWSSNHEKWCTHMLGARQLIKETPYREMSRQILALHQKKRRRFAKTQAQNQYGTFFQHMNSPNHEVADIDLGLVSRLTGRPVNFVDDSNESAANSKTRQCTNRDIKSYELMMDLYWWFCKMDVYQSTLGASKLFMEFDLWTQCPPRAPINRIRQVYGTFDHLLLVLSRLSNFVANDLPRKRKAREQETGASPRGQTSPPLFAGMFPGRGSIELPRGLSPPKESFPSAEQILNAVDLETSTQKALEEWSDIMQAFQLFKSSLGPDFDPDQSKPPKDSPFGPTLKYHAYAIAGIWMNFYMGLVILHRAHPSMPPFAMVAAHMIAKETDPYADEIGRIAAGVADGLSVDSVVSTLQSSALIECCFPIFVGAVQYRGKLQRQWAIRLLHQITRHTGWQTGDQIASGCEGAWRKAAAMGVAPVYEPESESDALRQGWTTRRLDERIQEVDEGHNRPVLQRSDRAHVAFGLLSVEDDMERLTLED